MGDQDRKSYRGYGLAAVAGLGIGAALYYFLNNRQQEQPHSNSHRNDEQQRQNSLRSNTDADRRKRSSSVERKQDEFRSRSWTLEQCTICFENMLIDSANPTLTLRCGHSFHLACASPWLEKQNTCPNCRKNLNA